MDDYKTTLKDKMLKDNAIRLVKNHKKTCRDPECNISLYLLSELIEAAGIKLTQKEKGEFI